MTSQSTRRKGRGPTPTSAIPKDAFDPGEFLFVLVDYHRSPLGAWTAVVDPIGLPPASLDSATAHDSFHNAMYLINALSDEVTASISTMHCVDGDPTAWVELASQEGFLDCISEGASLSSAPCRPNGPPMRKP
ncbi:hypothetical protein GCM10010464_29340 [Pseudonocardia yunnanensis]|uniref:Uncharacterized protein n=1 Tax=Pseudonocardia yunnanensis TaxID=58107 RepID=A0ABW4EYX5_9PSEU